MFASLDCMLFLSTMLASFGRALNWMFIFWDFLGSIFMLHDQIMHALYSYRSLRLPSFEFWGSSRASGAILPCFGAV